MRSVRIYNYAEKSSQEKATRQITDWPVLCSKHKIDVAMKVPKVILIDKQMDYVRNAAI